MSTNQRTTVTQEEVSTHSTGGTAHHMEPRGEALGQPGGRKSAQESWVEALLCFGGKEPPRQGQQDDQVWD